MIDPILDDESPDTASESMLRQFAGLCLLILCGLGFWQGLARERHVLGLIIACLGLALGLVGLVSPRSIRPVFLTLLALTFPIGWVVSRLILATLYFGIFTPVALLFKLIGRDALERRYDPGRETYWKPKPAIQDVRSYFRQS